MAPTSLIFYFAYVMTIHLGYSATKTFASDLEANSVADVFIEIEYCHKNLDVDLFATKYLAIWKSEKDT